MRRRKCQQCGTHWQTYEWEKSELEHLLVKRTRDLRAQNEKLKQQLEAIQAIINGERDNG